MFEKKNFALYTPVRLHSLGIKQDGSADTMEGATGYILGKSFVNVLDSYIVMLDKPLPDALAVSITEACISEI